MTRPIAALTTCTSTPSEISRVTYSSSVSSTIPTRPLVVITFVPGVSAATVSACRARCLRCVRLMNQIIPTIRISGSSSVKPEPPPEEAIGTARSCIWSQNPSSIGNTGVRHALLKRAGRNGMA
jgi:hypothetical protein